MFYKVKIRYQGCVHGDVAAIAVYGVTNGRDSCRDKFGLRDWIDRRVILYPPDYLARQTATCDGVLQELSSHGKVVRKNVVEGCEVEILLNYILSEVQVETNQVLFGVFSLLHNSLCFFAAPLFTL